VASVWNRDWGFAVITQPSSVTNRNRFSKRQVRLPKSADYSAQLVEEFLRDEEANNFRPSLPEGCNFQVVHLDPAVMHALKQRSIKR